MGNNSQSPSFLKKGQGLRILTIKLNSPFDGQVQPFFDFIIDVIPLGPQRSPKQILEKLTTQGQNNKKSRPKDFNQIIAQNQDKKIQIKLVSTKQRNVRSIIITPNRNWNGSMDLIGINVRKQRYDQAFDTYAPVSDIVINSPIHSAGLKEGQYMLGCLQFQYDSLNKFIQGIYDRFFDKEVSDKHIHLAIYDFLHDQVMIKAVLLKRGWGGKGLLGCQFLQGQLYKFPINFKQRREILLQKQQTKVHRQKIKYQLGQCDGASKTLYEALKNKKNRKGKHLQAIKNMISIPLPQIPQTSIMNRQGEMIQHQRSNISESQQGIMDQQNMRIGFLQRRVSHLEQTLSNIRQYLDIIASQQQNSQQKQSNFNENQKKSKQVGEIINSIQSPKKL